MSDFAKGGQGGPISDLVRATTSHSAHLDHIAPSSSSSSSSSSRFRRPSSPATTGDQEFGSFAARPSAHGINAQVFDPVEIRARDADWVAGERPTRGAQHDGFEVAALLAGSTTTTDEIDRDWESELSERHRIRHDIDCAIPVDPTLSDSELEPRRGRDGHLAGDLSPTSAELLSSLSSLDLSSIAYLKTLLALPPEQAVQRYFDEVRYSDDVWGVSNDVRGVMDRLHSDAEKGNGQETGKEKAVRRLGMLMRHLKLDGQPSAAISSTQDVYPNRTGKGKGKAVETTGDRADEVEKARAEWAAEWAEYPIAAGHKNLPPLSPPQSQPTSARITPLAHAPDPPPRRPSQVTSQPFSVPSSLSSEAFVVHGYSDPNEDQTYPEGVYHEVPAARRPG